MMTAFSSIQLAALQFGVNLHQLRLPFWSGQNRLLVAGLVLAMAMSLLAVGVLSLLRRDYARQGPTMRRLCRALRIESPHRRLLESMAMKTGVRCPATLLVSSGCFDTARRRYKPQGIEAQQLRYVRQRIFER